MAQHKERDERYGKLLLRLQHRGISLADAAGASGLTQPTIRRYGSGESKPTHSASKPAWEHVLRLAGLTLDQFESGDFSSEPPPGDGSCASCERAKIQITQACSELMEAWTLAGPGSPASAKILGAIKSLLKVSAATAAFDAETQVAAADRDKSLSRPERRK
jgi:transcriptional regulator with XRE-family HTH domain